MECFLQRVLSWSPSMTHLQNVGIPRVSHHRPFFGTPRGTSDKRPDSGLVLVALRLLL